MLQSAPITLKTTATKLFLRVEQVTKQPLPLQTPQERSKCSQKAWRIEMTGCIVASCFAIWTTTTIHAMLKE